MTQQNYMGEFLHKKPKPTIHTILNHFLTHPQKFQLRTAFIIKEIQFPDVSFYQAEIDYGIMSTKTGSIIIRVGQGVWKDGQFERNYAEAKRTGLLVGVYWFYDGRTSPADQAELLISLLQGKKLELGVYIDWEHNYGGRWEGLPNVVAMMELVDELLSYEITKDIGLYTGYYFFRANTNPLLHASQYNYLRSRPLWLAWYTTDSTTVLIPAPWTSLTIWQFGTPVLQWGQATAEIDMNFFNGTKEDFYLCYGGNQMQVIKGTVKQNISLRKGPGTTFLLAYWNDKNYLTPGQTIEANNNQFQWLHITKIDGQSITTEIWASAGSSEQYISWDWVTVTDEPPPPEPEPIVLAHTIVIETMSDGSIGSITVDGEPYH